MTNLLRKEQLIFANNKTNNQVAVFGSRAQSGAMSFSDDPNIIQNVENGGVNWCNGWESAVINSNSPFMEDFNAISYVNSYNIAYLLQKGIPEWSENTIYYKGSITVTINELDSIPTFYYSIADNNKGNNPKLDIEEKNWKVLELGGNNSTGLPTASLVTSTIPLSDNNLHLADGSVLPSDGIYSGFYNYMLNLYNNKLNVFCTEEEYEQDIKINGSCSKYVLNEGVSIRLPTLNNTFIKVTNNVNDNTEMNSISNGLSPDWSTQKSITSPFTADKDYFIIGNAGGYPFYVKVNEVTVYNGGGNYDYGRAGAVFLLLKKGDVLNFEGNIVLSSYDVIKNTTSNNTVNYLVYIVLGTRTKTDIEIDIDNVTNDLNNKLDKDISNLSTIGKEKLFLSLIPDYESVIKQTYNEAGQEFTIDEDGFIQTVCYLSMSENTNRAMQIKINDIIVYEITIDLADTNKAINFYSPLLPVKKGDIVYTKGGRSSNARFLHFYPLKQKEI